MDRFCLGSRVWVVQALLVRAVRLEKKDLVGFGDTLYL